MRKYFEEDEDDDFEDWEGDYQCFEEKDWEGLMKLRTRALQKDPDEYYTQERYAEALLLNNKYEETIKFLTPLHREYPESSDFSHKILQALFALGKTESEFNWIVPPLIWKIDSELIDRCYRLLKKEKDEMHIIAISDELFMLEDAYLHFTPDELADALSKDERFQLNELKWVSLKNPKKVT